LPRESRSHRFGAAAVTLPIVAAVTLLAALRGPALLRWSAERDMDAIVDASMTLRYRPSLARLSGAFPYREPMPPQRRISARRVYDDPSYAQLYAVIARLQREAGENPSLSQHHALGVSYLMADNVTAALEALENAVRSETDERGEIIAAIRRSRDYALLNDLAAAYYASFERSGDLALQPLALEAAECAWAGLKSAQTAWTRAVVIDSFHVHERSAAAWRDVQARESYPEWREAARRRLHDALLPTDGELWPPVRSRLLASRNDDAAVLRSIDRFHQDVRLLCEDELLPRWGEAVVRGDRNAPDRLAKIAALGRALEQAGGGRSVAGAVDAIRIASPAALLRLAKGHAAYGAGRRADRNNQAEEAMRAMDDALAALTPDLTPFAWRTRIEHAGEFYSLNDYGHARAELQEILGKAPRLSDDCIGSANAYLGSIHLLTGSYKDAADHYRRALEAFRRAGERENEATQVSRVAAALRHAGEDAQARTVRYEAMKLLDRVSEPRHRHEAMIEEAYVAVGNDHQAIADLFLDTLVANDVAAHDYVKSCSSLMWRSAYRYHRGLLAPAAADLDEAQRICRSIADAAVRERSLANLQLAKFSLGSADSSAALPELDKAIQFYRRTDSHVWLRTAYFARARHTARRGETTAAERDYRAALDETEASREKIDERQMRMSFTATADEIADGYIDFLLQQHRERDAFETADRIRLRELTDSPTARWGSSFAGAFLPTLQASLPAGSALVEYRVLEKSIIVWVVSANAFRTVVLPASMTAIKPALAALESDARDDTLKTTASLLYDTLLRRLDPLLKDSSTLVIVPDDDLERVPFSALYDRLHGRYVVQTRATIVAPSAALFVQSVARSRERANDRGRMVVVQAAAGGGNLPSLPEAAAEAQSIARLYPNTQLIETSGAAGSTILSRVGEASFLQFVGHTSLAGGAVRALRLGDAPQAQVGNADIMAAKLPKLRLVYLSACETDNGPILKSEGSITIARSFFAAGVPVVVGTLWPVDDAAARIAALSFHEHLRRGNTPAESLRQAQLSLLSRDQSRADWAAFRVIGAGI
jgi:CHAT domain-containing protein